MKKINTLKSCSTFILLGLAISLTNCHKKSDDPKPVNQKPVANFSFTIVNNGTLPCTVNFTDTSKYADTYKWDFGDGNTSATQKPSNIYASAKTYNVKLIVSNGFGKDSITKQVIITLNKPKANFDFTIVDNGNLPTTVNFKNSTIGGSTYQWYFDDGNKSALTDPVEKYTASKSYNVKLVATNAVGKDSIIKAVAITINKPASGFTFTINNTGSLPVNVAFTNTAQRAISYLWDFNDGSTSTSLSPQHSFTKNNAYTVKLKVTNSSGSDSTIKVVNLSKSPFTQTYISFDNKTYNLYSWEGKYVTILMRNNNLDVTTMFNWVHTMDSCYSWYKSVTGQEPIKYAPTYLDNHTTIADVVTTCGAGCGYLGFTGIEMQNAYTDRMYNFVLQNNEYDQELFYEFGRNFWFYGNQLAYKTNDPVTTGYAIFMRFMAMDATKVNPAPFNNTPWIDFRTDLEGLVDIYQANSSYNWSNTLGVSVGVQNPLNLGAGDLLASFLMRLQRDYGGNTFVNKFWKQAGLMPTTATTQDAVDNFVLAACAAANKNLTNLFINTWRWPVSASAQTAASKYP